MVAGRRKGTVVARAGRIVILGVGSPGKGLAYNKALEIWHLMAVDAATQALNLDRRGSGALAISRS
jgi:hypothetical protein